MDELKDWDGEDMSVFPPKSDIVPLMDENGILYHYPTEEVKSSSLDEIINKWAEQLERVYKYQTAGDYTFHGILASFLRECDEPS